MGTGTSPETIGRYRIVKRLGGGDTSEVLLALSQGPHGFERIVALKRLLPRFEWDAAMTRLLAREAVAYARLAHPAIVRLYDFFDVDGHALLVLEHVDGTSLAALLALLRTRGETLGDAASIYVASRVFAALAAAHAARDPLSGEFAPVIHRDVCPGSVLLPWDGFVKLGDFGFAKVKGLTGETSDTRRGLLKGSLGYMAPEQALGDAVSPRTDVYAGCLLLRELLVGRPAFDPATPELELLRAMAEADLPPIEAVRAGISPSLADALRRGLARDPEERTLTAAEMMRVLRQETDPMLAQSSLVDTLARFRSSEPRESTPPQGVPASSGTMRFERLHLPPEAMPSRPDAASALDSDSHTTLRIETPHAVIMLRGASAAPRAIARPRGKRAGIVAVAALAAIAASLALAFGPHGTAPVATVAPSGATMMPSVTAAPAVAIATPSAAPVIDAAVVPLAPAASSAPLPAPTTGEVATPARARSHRVFVDGRYAAPRSGATLTLRCGEHVVRIGSKGRDQAIDVPCGGVIEVAYP